MRRTLVLALLFLAAATTPAHALLCIPLLGCSCTVTASDLTFASFSPLDGAQDGVGVLEVDCTGIADVAPSVIARLDDGLYGSMAARQMRTGAGDALSYNIYTTSQRNVVWGDLTGGAANTTINGGLISLGHWTASRSMFGRATPTSATKAGAYADTVVVTIIW